MSDAVIIAAPLAVLAACSVLRLAWDIMRHRQAARSAARDRLDGDFHELLSECGSDAFSCAEEVLAVLPLTPSERERWLQRRFGVEATPLFRALQRRPRGSVQPRPDAGAPEEDREPEHG